MIRNPSDYAPFAGIGSRETPRQTLILMREATRRLCTLGYTLRSGGAEGADTACHKGALGHNPEIYVPWDGFVKDPELVDDCVVVPKLGDAYSRAMQMAASHHPNWAACGPGARKLHARNVMQVLGANLDHQSEFVMCWTADGKASGGTGQALRIASTYGIPVCNLQRPEHVAKLLDYLNTAEAAAKEICMGS